MKALYIVEIKDSNGNHTQEVSDIKQILSDEFDVGEVKHLPAPGLMPPVKPALDKRPNSDG